jgi:hypothetical protein
VLKLPMVHERGMHTNMRAQGLLAAVAAGTAPQGTVGWVGASGSRARKVVRYRWVDGTTPTTAVNIVGGASALSAWTKASPR